MKIKLFKVSYPFELFNGFVKLLFKEVIKSAKELKEENEQLKAKVNDLSNMELEERDIVCGAGRFRLEEWGKHRFHQFYDDDTPLEDETVVIRLMELSNEVEQLRRYVYHCPQTCNKILKYLSKSETEDLKAVNGAFDDDKYFDEEIDTLRSWER